LAPVIKTVSAEKPLSENVTVLIRLRLRSILFKVDMGCPEVISVAGV